MGLIAVFEHVAAMQAEQLVDSRLATTRHYWRRKLGFPEAVALDPRPLREILRSVENRATSASSSASPSEAGSGE